MPVGVEAAGEQVQSLLAARTGGFELDPRTGERVVIVDGRRCYVAILPLGPDSAIVQAMVPLIAGVADTDELCEAVATAELTFGRLLLVDAGGGGRSVLAVVRFHADQLRSDVMEHALAQAAAIADRFEPVLEQRFGATWTLEAPS